MARRTLAGWAQSGIAWGARKVLMRTPRVRFRPSAGVIAASAYQKREEAPSPTLIDQPCVWVKLPAVDSLRGDAQLVAP